MKRNKLILEFTEFNAQRLNPDSAQMSVQVDNPELSVNAFDRHEDGIRAGLAKINNIMNSLSNSNGFRSLKSKFSLDEQNIQALKILRVISKDDVNYNIFISFVIEEEEYFGEIFDVLSHNVNMKSEVFKNTNLVQSKEWIIKTKGLIIKAIKEWLKPEEGKYILLKDFINCNSTITGNSLRVEKGTEIEVVRSFDNKIIININNNPYSLINNNFIYFNYWFEKVIEKQVVSE